MTVDRDKAFHALPQLATWRADDRESWLSTGMAMHSAAPDESGLAAWITWSRQSEKFDESECRRQWRSFKPDGGIGLGSLLRWARDDAGWTPSLGTSSKPQRAPVSAAKSKKVTTYATLEQAIQAAARSTGGIEAGHWDYRDEEGAGIFSIVRFDLEETDDASKVKKTFRPLHRNAHGWAAGDPPGKLPLFRLPEVLQSDPKADMVFVAEGEKAAEALVRLGFVGTTSSHGCKAAAKTDWTPVSGRLVIILPDRDQDGEKYAATVSKILLGLNPPAEVKIARVKGLPAKGDIADLATEGLTPDQIRERIRVAIKRAKPEGERGGLRPTRMADVQSRRLEWLWKDRIPLGKLVNLSGDMDHGKTTIALDIAARVSSGRPFPDTPDTPNQAGDVLLLAVEDDPGDWLKPCLQVAGADLERVFFVEDHVTRINENGKKTTESLTLDTIPDHLEHHLKRYPGTRLLVIDPATAFVGDADSNNDPKVRQLLVGLKSMAQRHAVTVLTIQHFNKRSGANPKHRVSGSGAWAAVPRAVHGVGWVPEDRELPEEDRRRVLKPIKLNISQKRTALTYRFESATTPDPVFAGDTFPKILWGESIEVTAEEVFSDSESIDKGAREEAKDWLRAQLTPEAVQRNRIRELSKAAGFAWTTVERASIEIHVLKRPGTFGGDWVWELPESEAASNDHVPPVSANTPLGVELTDTVNLGGDWKETTQTANPLKTDTGDTGSDRGGDCGGEIVDPTSMPSLSSLHTLGGGGDCGRDDGFADLEDLL